MAKKNPQKVSGMVIKQDAGRVKFPVGPDGRVCLGGKKKMGTVSDDVGRYRK